MRKFLRTVLMPFAGIFLLTLALTTKANAQEDTTAHAQQTATITTDKPDYEPRSTAVFTGSGFAPYENVELKVKNLSYPCNTVLPDSSYTPWTVQADADGAFVTPWTVCDCGGDSLRLKATGQTSGLMAYAYFTDANSGSGTMTVSPNTACAGSSGNSFTFSFRNGSGLGGGYSSNSYARIVIPAGWTAPQTSSASNPGFISVANVGILSSSSISTITGTGPWTITITFSTILGTGSGFDLTYDGGGSSVTVPSAGSYTFTASTHDGSGGTPVNLSLSPVITVTTPPSAPASVTATPNSICSGSSSNLNATSAGNTIKWYTIAAGGTSIGTSNSGANFSVSPAVTTTYYAEALSTACGASAARTPVTITVNNLPAITTAGTVSPVCFSAGSQTASLAYTATTNNPVSYSINWNSGITDQGTTLFAFAAAGGTINNIAIQANAPAGTHNGTMTLTNANGCASTQSVSITVSRTTISTQPSAATQSICLNGTAAALSVTASAGSGATISNYTWFSNTTNSTTGPNVLQVASSAIANTYNPLTTTAGTLYYFVVVTNSNGCTITSSVSGSITINPLIANNIVSSDQSICSGSTPIGLTGTFPTGGIGTYNYLWQVDDNAGFSSPASASGTNTTQNYSPGSLTQTAWYRRRVISDGCTDFSPGIKITVNPVIGNNTMSSAQTICSGSTPAALTGALPTGGIGTYNYNWESSTTSATTGFAAAAGINNGQNYAPGALTQTTWYRRTVTSDGCTSISGAIQVTVNAVPTSVSALPLSSAICAGGNVNLTGSANVSSTSISTLLSENFNGTPAFTATGTNNGGGIIWTKENSGFNVLLVTTWTSPDASPFMLTYTASFGDATTNSTLVSTPVLNSTGYTSLSLSFKHTYKQGDEGSPFGMVEVSTDPGNNTWTTVQTYTTNQGSGAAFATVAGINLNAYINQPNLKIRFNFSSSVSLANSWWAIDDVLITGNVPSVPQFSWAANPPATGGLPGGAGSFSTANSGITVNPGANTTYTLTARDPLTSCTTDADPITVTVNTPPAISTQPVGQAVTYGAASAGFSIVATGTPAPAYQWQVSTNGGSGFTDISDSTSATLSVANPTVSMSDYLYHVKVTNSCSTVTSNDVSLTVDPLAVSVTADAKSKIYGDIDPALTFVSSPAAGTELANGQTISFTGALTRDAGENAGTYAINQGSVDNDNYTISYTGANLTINPLAVSVTADAKSKIYGDIDPALTYVSSPAAGTELANGQTISFTGALTRDAGENAGTYAINQGSVDNSNYTITYTGANLTINPLAVSVTADAKSKIYGDIDPALTFVSSPAAGTELANGQTISFTGALTRDAGENAGTYAINQGSVDNDNYTISYTGANLTINPLAVSVTADAKSKIYGDIDPALTYVSSPAAGTELANGQTISFTGALTRDAGENAGTYAINQGSVDNSNYTITYTGANLTINPLAVSVTADAKSKTYGDVDPALTFVSSPAVGTELANGQTISFTGSLTRDAGENAGTYAINQGSVDNSNYTISYTGANLTINPLAVSVTADAKSKTYGDVDPALTYVSLPAAGTVLDNGNTISFTGSLTRDAGENAGTYAINQGSVDNDNYTISYTGANLTINPLAVSVTADAKSKTYGDIDPALTYVSLPAAGTVLDNGNTISFTGSLTREAGENAGTYAINHGSVDNSNYTISYTGANLTINPLAVSVTADAKSKTYGDVDPALTYVSLPAAGTVLDNGNTISFTGSLTREAGENAGTYAINQGSVDNSNYTISYTGANLTINPLAVSVTADAKSKTYGDVDPALTYVSSPIVGTELANGQTISFTGALTRDAGENAGTYAINPGSVNNNNYTISYTGANLTINPLAVSVTADAKSKTYGDVDPALTFVSSPAVGTELANGQTISFTGALTRDAGENAGTYAINQGSVDNDNYTITYNGANLTITQREITITADTKTKVYGNADPALTAQVTSGTIVNGDAATGSLTRVSGENAGTYQINKGTYTYGSNYNETHIPANLTITQKAITITADAKSKTYGDVDPALTYQVTSGSLVPGDGFSGALTRVAGKNVGAYSIQQGTLALSSNYNLSYVGANLTITSRLLTVTVTGVNKVYDGTTAATVIFSDNKIAGDAVTESYASATFNNKNVGTNKPVSVIGISISGADAVNYTLAATSASTTANITARAITIKADAKSKVYGATDPALTYQVASGSLAPGDVMSGALSRVAGENPGTYAINLNTVNPGTNYTFTYVGALLTIAKAAVTPVVTVTPNAQQYSDLVTFSVKIPGGAPSLPGASKAAQSATFKVGTQVIGTAAFTVSGTDLAATLTAPLTEPESCGVKGQMAPGTRTVTAVINSPNSNFSISNLQPATTLTITKENSTVTYTGQSYFPTSCSYATVVLSAIIKDYDDGNDGDISNAKVTFRKGSVTGPVLGTSNVCVVPLNFFDPTCGIATVMFTYTLTSAELANKGVTFDVYAVVDNYYTGDNNGSPGVVTIATHGTDVIAGAGSVSITSSTGTYAGTSGTKANFGYTMKYTKNGVSTAGQVDIVFSSNNKTYQIKSTAVSAVTVSGQTANFSSKATLTDITNSASPVSIGSNLDLLVDMNDVCSNGQDDEVSFQLKNGSAVVFSSNWISSKTKRKEISCGNIEVRNGSVCSSGSYYANAATLAQPSQSFSVSVINNPSEGTSEFTLAVKGDAGKKVEIRVVNMAGQQVYGTEGYANQTYRFGAQFTSGMYIVQVIQGRELKSLKVIKGKG